MSRDLVISERRERQRQLREYKFFTWHPVNDVRLSPLTELGLSDGANMNPDGTPRFHDGPRELLGVSVWVVDQQKSGNLYLYFKSREEAQKLFDKLDEHRRQEVLSRTCPLYELYMHGWIQKRSYLPTLRENLIGYDQYFDRVRTDVERYLKNKEIYSTLGEKPSLNYLLYGPPGVGKTTLIKTLASYLDMPLFVVHARDFRSQTVDTILNPDVGLGEEMRMLVFEDFDRYLTDPSAPVVMSDLLNAMDGVASDMPVIRFFNANSEEFIANNKALMTRMSARMRFNHPTLDCYTRKLNRMLSAFHVESKTDVLVKSIEERVVPAHVSLRVFSNFVLRFMFEEDCVAKMVQHLDELFEYQLYYFLCLMPRVSNA